MGDEFSRKPEGPATSAAKLKVAIALFLAATFGLLALLSVPVSSLLPPVSRVPQVIGGAVAPLDPLFRPFLGAGTPIGPDLGATALGVTPRGIDAVTTVFLPTNPIPSPPLPPPPPPQPPYVPGPPAHRPPPPHRCDSAGAVAGCKDSAVRHRIHHWLKAHHVKDRQQRPGRDALPEQVGQRVVREAQRLLRAAEVPARLRGPVWPGPRGARAR